MLLPILFLPLSRCTLKVVYSVKELAHSTQMKQKNAIKTQKQLSSVTLRRRLFLSLLWPMLLLVVVLVLPQIVVVEVDSIS